jgi:hypothetical protein
LAAERRGTLFGTAVVVEMHNTGDTEAQRDVVALVEHVLAESLLYILGVIVNDTMHKEYKIKRAATLVTL